MMSRIQVGVVRYASVARRIAEALRIEVAPDCRLRQGRTTITFRHLGASHWPAQRQIEYALHASSIARREFAVDPRRIIRDRARRAIVVVFEDATLDRGCAVTSRWECVVPAAAQM